MRRGNGVFALGMALVAAPCLAACGGAGTSDAASEDHGERIATVENGLRPAVVLEGEPTPAWTLEERMAFHEVPGVSVAYIQDGRVAWARAYGLADVEAGTPVTTETLFQAASISKPVAALATLSLVEEGALSLNAPINDVLKTWSIPDNEFTADSAVTLRHLLTHSSGLTVWGFPGYRKDQPYREGQALPTNPQVLDGEGNTDPVRVYKIPGISWQYSGGGYTVMEQAVEDVTDTDFATVVRERVLEPGGMAHSTYAQPLPEARWADAARGYRGDGSEVEGEWHSYPEQAAAGLWTTPTDLATLSVHLLSILSGSETEGVISRDMLEAMLTPNHGGEETYRNWGLGFSLNGPDTPRSFGHGGSNEGFRANWRVWPETGQGLVIMTNGDQGSAVAAELGRALGEVYGLPGIGPEVRSRIPATPAMYEAVVGEWTVEEMPDFVITIRTGEDGTLEADVPGQEVTVFYPESPELWFELGGGELRLEIGDDGVARRASTNEGVALIRK